MRRLPLITLAGSLFLSLASPHASHAAILVTGLAPGSEGPAIAGATVEDSEDVNLISGLTIRMGGIPGFGARSWTGTLPRVFKPSLASSCCTLGGPFPNNLWDGVGALTNGGLFGTGSSGLSPGDGQFWDFQFADSVVFLFSKPKGLFGIGLSNFQSAASGDPALTDHELIVNGVSRGRLETLLSGWVSGQYIRNRYLLITATAPDAILSVSIQNITQADGLVFDKLAMQDPIAPVNRSNWGRVKSIYK